MASVSKNDIKNAIKEHLKDAKNKGARTHDAARQTQDATDALCAFPYLRPSVGLLPGTTTHLLKLEGTVQMMYQGHGYYVPLAVYLRDDHPNTPPVCVVTPTPEMTIKPNHRHVDVAGIVYLPYLHEWSKKSNLIDMIKALSDVFTADPFIFKKPPTPAVAHVNSGTPGRTPSGGTPSYASSSVQQKSMKTPPYALDPGGGSNTPPPPPPRPAPSPASKLTSPVDKEMSAEISRLMISKAKEMEELDSVLENSFRCPISMEIMVDPVFAADGHTYERAEMERWLLTKSTSPLTNEVLPHKILVPNHNLRSQIREYKEKHPNAR